MWQWTNQPPMSFSGLQATYVGSVSGKTEYGEYIGDFFSAKHWVIEFLSSYLLLLLIQSPLILETEHPKILSKCRTTNFYQFVGHRKESIWASYEKIWKFNKIILFFYFKKKIFGIANTQSIVVCLKFRLLETQISFYLYFD